jgi:hypothetical protein
MRTGLSKRVRFVLARGRRVGVLLGVVGVATVLVTSTTAANPPSRFTFTFDQTFPSGLLTAACGFDVFVHIEGTSAALAFYDTGGTVVREIDTSAGFKTTLFAPSTGKSFTYPLSGAFDQKYINGTSIGSHAVVTETGLVRGTGSTAPDAGRLVFDAVIIGTSPEGLPIVDVVDLISATGHFNDDVVAARCAALS